MGSLSKVKVVKANLDNGWWRQCDRCFLYDLPDYDVYHDSWAQAMAEAEHHVWWHQGGRA